MANPLANFKSRRTEERAYVARAIVVLVNALDDGSPVNLVEHLKRARRKLKPPAHMAEPERQIVAEFVLHGIIAPVASAVDRDAMKVWLNSLEGH